MSHGGPSGGATGRVTAFRSFSRDRSVLEEKLQPGILRRVLSYARPFKLLVWLFLITMAVDAVLTVVQPLLFRRIIDSGISAGNSAVVTTTAILVAVIAVIDAGVGLWSRYLSARIGEGLIFNLRSEVFDHVQRQSVAFFTRAQTGALVSRLNTDVIGAQQAFTSTLSGVVGNLITVTVVLITMFWLSWQITVVALILVPIFLLPARYMGRRLQQLTRQQMQWNADLSIQMTERFNVAGALLVKLFGRPSEEKANYDEKAAGVRDMGVKIALSNRYFFTALTLVASLATAIAYGLGGNLVINETLTLGTLLAIIALLAQLYAPLTALSNVRVDVMTALVSFDRVFEVLDLKPMVADKPDAGSLPRGAAPAVSFDHVSFRYPSSSEVSLASLESVARQTHDPVHHGDTLTDVSFDVAPGQTVALVGPSGAGKTTITALVSRLYDPTDGTVSIAGVDIDDVTQESLHAAVGVVTQDSHMFHDTIRANLAYARPGASDQEILEACDAARIGESGPGPAAGSGHRRRRPRPPPVGWREAALGDRPAAAEATGRGGAGRGNGAPGQRERVGGATGAGDRAGGPDRDRDRPPAEHHPRRGQDPGGRGGPDRRDRGPRAPAGGGRTVRRPVPHPVRGRGGRPGLERPARAA